MAKQDDWERITLRLPPHVHQALMNGAVARSLNAEIVERLEYTLPGGEMDKEMAALVEAANEAKSRLSISELEISLGNRQAADLRRELSEAKEELSKAQKNAELFHKDLLHMFKEKERLDAEVEQLQSEIMKLTRERDDASQRGALIETMSSTLQEVVNVWDVDRTTLREIEGVVKFLRGDAVSIEAELDSEELVPRAVGPSAIKSYLGREIVEAIDRRGRSLLRLLANKLPDSGKYSFLASALSLAHELSLTAEEREIAHICVDQNANNAAEFHEYVTHLADQAPDEKRETYRQALEAMMPRLFKRWGLRTARGLLS